MQFLQFVEKGFELGNVEAVPQDLRKPEWYSNAFRANIAALSTKVDDAMTNALVGAYEKWAEWDPEERLTLKSVKTMSGMLPELHKSNKRAFGY